MRPLEKISGSRVSRMAGHGGARPGAGRPAGQPNRATRELKALAQEYTSEAIEALAEVMRDTTAPAMARVKAAEALLDRGHGRPTQHIEATISPFASLSDADLRESAELLREVLAMRQAGGTIEGDVAGHA